MVTSKASEYFKSIFTKEAQEGDQGVITKSSGGASGINIGGVLGGGFNNGENKETPYDTRTRAVSGNIIADAAYQYVANLDIKGGRSSKTTNLVLMTLSIL